MSSRLLPSHTVPGWQFSQEVNVSSGQSQSWSLTTVKFRPKQRRAPSLQSPSSMCLEPTLAHSVREVLKDEDLL